jgi:hypothetical protein
MAENPLSDLPTADTDRPARAPTVAELKANIQRAVAGLMEWALRSQTLTFDAFETQLVPKVLAVGCLLVQLFLCMREAPFQATPPQPPAGYKRMSPVARQLGTFFGKVCYWRTYFYRKGAGYYPLDGALGLTSDGFSMRVRSLAARIATKVSYAQAGLVLGLFLEWAPAQESIEGMVLGLGRHTSAWFESAPAPVGDGALLVIQIDSKATPTATETELAKRRGPRRPNPHPGSQRHRGRVARHQRGGKPRRQKGDKAKNGKAATIVTMYTLKKSCAGQLEGPINKKVYASYAPKRHAVAIARREADKRGFARGCGKTIQIVTDGDNDLQRYIEELFPEALHTMDVYHVTEYLWEAGACLYAEGSAELVAWVNTQREALYDGRAAEIVAAIAQRLAHLDPAQTSARTRLQKVHDYLAKRVHKMNYKELQEQDLEIASGAVEGAVNYVIAKRFDTGGMRWIKARAEALLQLRCIEVNNDWAAFIEFVHDKTMKQAQHDCTNPSLKCTQPAPLPTYGLA